MVSLARSLESTMGDGFLNEGTINPSINDTQALLQPIVGERSKRVGYVGTVCVAALHFILAIVMGILVTVLAVIWPRNDRRECESYFLALYIHVMYWAFSFIFDFYFRRKHTESRIEGYLEFYQSIIKHSRAPFYITTICNTIILTLAGVFHQQYGDMEGRCSGNLLDPLHYLSALILTEVAIIASILASYIVKVRAFNKQRVCPDAMRDEWMASFIRDSYSGGEVGYRERDNYVGDLLEKQADLLRYLKEQNSRLVQKVMILSFQLQEKHTASIS